MNKCIDLRVKDVTLNVKLFELFEKDILDILMVLKLLDKSLPFKVLHSKILLIIKIKKKELKGNPGSESAIYFLYYFNSLFASL